MTCGTVGVATVWGGGHTVQTKRQILYQQKSVKIFGISAPANSYFLNTFLSPMFFRRFSSFKQTSAPCFNTSPHLRHKLSLEIRSARQPVENRDLWGSIRPADHLLSHRNNWTSVNQRTGGETWPAKYRRNVSAESNVLPPVGFTPPV